MIQILQKIADLNEGGVNVLQSIEALRCQKNLFTQIAKAVKTGVQPEITSQNHILGQQENLNGQNGSPHHTLGVGVKCCFLY